MRNATIIIPTYNEAGNIAKLIGKISDEIRKLPHWNISVLVVDSFSQDKTADIVKKIQKNSPMVHLLETKKRGLGKAYLEGYRYAFSRLNPYLVIQMDADLSHDPKEIPAFIDLIERGADFVIGSRYMKGGSIPDNWGIHRKIFSIFGNLIVRLGFMILSVTEWTNGYRAIKSWVIKSIVDELNPYSGYVFQIATIDKALKQNARVVEIPIQFKDRTSGVSKINVIQYIFDIFSYIFAHSSFVKFVIVGTIGFAIDFLLSALFVRNFRQPILVANLLSMETAIFSNFLLNNFWSFSHKKISSVKQGVVAFLTFNLTSLGAVAIQLAGIFILGRLFGYHLWQWYKVGLIVFVVIPYSYFFYNKIIWRKR